jgi:acyl-CoA thioesterase
MSMANASTLPPEVSPHEAVSAIRSFFASDPAAQALGIEVLEVAPGTVRLAMIVRPDMLNGHGICHGGMLFALADTAFAYACNSRRDAMVAAGASIEFLAPTPVGERLVATASETSRTTRHGIYDVVITNAAGEPLAHFRGRCARLRVPSAHTRGSEP